MKDDKNQTISYYCNNRHYKNKQGKRRSSQCKSNITKQFNLEKPEISSSRQEDLENHDGKEIVTSNTYKLKRITRSTWSELDDMKFYEGLKLFGLDFGMINTVFPEKSRKNLKIKYNKELKKNPEKIYSVIKQIHSYDKHKIQNLCEKYSSEHKEADD